MGLSNTQKGILSALCGFTAFAFADACSKWLGNNYDALTIIYWVYYSTFGFSLILSPFFGGLGKTIQTKKLHIHIARGICVLGTGLFIVAALSNGLSLASMYTILFLAPFIMSIAAIPIYKEKVSIRSWLIIAIGFSGILIAFHDGLSSFTPEVIYVFYALFFIVTSSLLSRPFNNTESILSLSLYPSMVVTLLISLTALPNVSLPSLHDLPIFVLDGFFVTIGLAGLAHSFRIAPYARVAPIHYCQMIIALILGYWFFNDIPDIWMLVGASVIIISGIMLATQKKG